MLPLWHKGNLHNIGPNILLFNVVADWHVNTLHILYFCISMKLNDLVLHADKDYFK